ncbi:unnamed protein product [Caenorhabditis auriculariae]|uniref:Uncharacterized protein n=1 Tax=Caenorhabditis auriculariae TaxID=2777116 RepID=A0A8S1HYB4_9PELO|nr:unnamed protein product [Caenorhabditis auriculariae]
MRKIDELSNERMKVVKENSRWAKKRVGDLYGSFYESFIVLMGKQLESMKKDLEEFPERKSTALISSSFEQQIRKEAEEQTKDMSLAELMSKFGIEKTIQMDSPRPFSETRKEKERVETALSSQKESSDRVKEILEQTERKREETRKRYEEEKVRREKSREEKRLQLEELKRKEQEIDDKSARQLEELEKRLADEEIQELQRKKKIEEEAAERSLREEKERKRAEEAWNRVIAQIKRNMFVESKWDKWFGQLRDAVSPLITSLRKVLFDVKVSKKLN